MAQTYKGEKLQPSTSIVGMLQRQALKMATKAKALNEQVQNMDAEITRMSADGKKKA